MRFITFVMTNGMNIFPILILSKLFLVHERIDKYVLPLIMFYCFKTTTLFLIRFKPIEMTKLLKLSLTFGMIGSILGFISEIGSASAFSLIIAIISGCFLGLCSGTLMPSHLTIQFHEKRINNFHSTGKEQIFSLIYAFLLVFLILKLDQHNLGLSFIFLGINIALLTLVLTTYPKYHLKESIPYPNYSIIETIFLFVTGFLSILILKSAKKVDIGQIIFPILLFLLSISLIYLFYIVYIKKNRILSLQFISAIIYKGMLTNFILVFCTFYQLLYHGSKAFYLVYFIYLIAIIVTPLIKKIYIRLVSSRQLHHYVATFLTISLLFLAVTQTFYIGVFFLTVISTELNQQLNEVAYSNPKLPKDYRLIVKYRLNNIGSILQQVIMFTILFITTKLLHSASLSEMFHDYSYKTANLNTLQPLKVTKIILLFIFIFFIPNLTRFIKNKTDNQL
ncbi:hypothetical protein CBF37_02215 [Vagococcus vulneris]|uniref:MFS transporter n=1 Tax=Vagococcus vulneris TaxID=1977869 RepID=A0A430A149_9ENTE|nr:hypothetical protein CBF37_02215 [Vagococcus vulneris]